MLRPRCQSDVRYRNGLSILAALAGLCLGIGPHQPACALRPTVLAEVKKRLTYGLTEIDNIVVAPDGATWVFLREPLLALESGTVRRTGHQMAVCVLGAGSVHASGSLVLTDQPGLSEVTHVEPMGFLGDGALLLGCTLGDRDPVRYRMVRLGPTGVEAVSGETFYSPPGHCAVVDPTGDVRTFLPFSGSGGVSCLVDGRSPTLDVLDRFDLRHESTPEYLRWPGPVSLVSTGVGEFVAVRGPSPWSSTVAVYRFEFRTLKLLDSLLLTRMDAPAREIHGVGLTLPRLVPDGDSNWLFMSSWASSEPTVAPAEPGILVYRLTRRLRLVRRRTAEQDATRSVTAAPTGTQFEIRSFIRHERTNAAGDVLDYATRAGIDYLGLAPDGRVYFASERDSFTTVMRSSGRDKGTKER